MYAALPQPLQQRAPQGVRTAEVVGQYQQQGPCALPPTQSLLGLLPASSAPAALAMSPSPKPLMPGAAAPISSFAAALLQSQTQQPATQRPLMETPPARRQETSALVGLGAAASSPQKLPRPVPPSFAAEAELPDLEAVEQQKVAFVASLEEQLKKGEELLRSQEEQQTEYIRQSAEAQKQQVLNQIDQLAQQQETQLKQKYAKQRMSLQHEYEHQKFALEKQANDLAMEYQRRKRQEGRMQKAQEGWMQTAQEVHKAHYQDQLRMISEIQWSAMREAGLESPSTGIMPSTCQAMGSGTGGAGMVWEPPVLNLAAYESEARRANFGPPKVRSPLAPTGMGIPAPPLPGYAATVPFFPSRPHPA